jgi:hypothetical protein
MVRNGSRILGIIRKRMCRVTNSEHCCHHDLQRADFD